MRLRLCSLWKRSSEVSLPFFEFHGAFFIVVDRAILTLGAAERNHLFDDLWQSIRLGADGPRAGNATERPHTALQSLCFFSRQELRGIVDDHNGAVSQNDFAFPREIERHNRNLFHVNV